MKPDGLLQGLDQWFLINYNTNLNIYPVCNHTRLVRIAKRLVRYNVADGRSSEKETQRRAQYSCEKCGKKFGAWKHLRQHKVESHSY